MRIQAKENTRARAESNSILRVSAAEVLVAIDLRGDASAIRESSSNGPSSTRNSSIPRRRGFLVTLRASCVDCNTLGELTTGYR